MINYYNIYGNPKDTAIVGDIWWWLSHEDFTPYDEYHKESDVTLSRMIEVTNEINEKALVQQTDDSFYVVVAYFKTDFTNRLGNEALFFTVKNIRFYCLLKPGITFDVAKYNRKGEYPSSTASFIESYCQYWHTSITLMSHDVDIGESGIAFIHLHYDQDDRVEGGLIYAKNNNVSVYNHNVGVSQLEIINYNCGYVEGIISTGLNYNLSVNFIKYVQLYPYYGATTLCCHYDKGNVSILDNTIIQVWRCVYMGRFNTDIDEESGERGTMLEFSNNKIMAGRIMEIDLNLYKDSIDIPFYNNFVIPYKMEALTKYYEHIPTSNIMDDALVYANNDGSSGTINLLTDEDAATYLYFTVASRNFRYLDDGHDSWITLRYPVKGIDVSFSVPEYVVIYVNEYDFSLNYLNIFEDIVDYDKINYIVREEDYWNEGWFIDLVMEFESDDVAPALAFGQYYNPLE